jgi:hypothetical protein
MRLSASTRACLALAVMLSAMVGQPLTPPALAQEPVDLTDIALTVDDLPEGFEIEPELTREEPLQDIGVTYTIAAKRDPSEERLSSGPVRVWQQVIRLDQGVIPVEFFAKMREQIISEQNLSPFPGALNNPNNVQLIGQTDVNEEERVVYGVGRLRDNIIWFTIAGGSPSGTTIQSAIALNDLSVTRYDSFRSTNGPPALVDALFQAPFLSDELPPGFNSGNIVRETVSDRAIAHNGVGEVDLEVQGTEAENRITFIVYASAPHARWSFDDAPRLAEQRGSTISRPEGYDYPVLCVMRQGERDGRTFGATSCLGLVRNVEVSAFSLVADAESGNLQDSLKLMDAGVKHLDKVASTVGRPG